MTLARRYCPSRYRHSACVPTSSGSFTCIGSRSQSTALKKAAAMPCNRPRTATGDLVTACWQSDLAPGPACNIDIVELCFDSRIRCWGLPVCPICQRSCGISRLSLELDRPARLHSGQTTFDVPAHPGARTAAGVSLEAPCESETCLLSHVPLMKLMEGFHWKLHCSRRLD